MEERQLKDELVAVLRQRCPHAVTLRHEDKITAGIPDISFTLRGTVWLEVKYANPHIAARGLQILTCVRLAKMGCCWFVIYQELRGQKRTIIADPRDVLEDRVENTPGERMTAGFNHLFVLEFIRRTNGDYEQQKHLSGDSCNSDA